MESESEYTELENAPELQEQIREGYAAYLRGEYRTIEEFTAELEAEIQMPTV